MRVLLATNLFISYLLAPEADSPPIAILEQMFDASYTLLIAQPLLDELGESVATKQDLANRIRPVTAARLVSLVASMAEPIEKLDEPIPRICRDTKDDYLIAHAIVGHADDLISGDHDLLVLDLLGALRIVSPTEFLELLRQAA